MDQVSLAKESHQFLKAGPTYYPVEALIVLGLTA
jgi:hypothetical protein